MGVPTSPHLSENEVLELIERVKRLETSVDNPSEDVYAALADIRKLTQCLEEEINARKALERALRKAEIHHDVLVDNAHEGIALVQKGDLVFINNSVCQITGRSREEIISRPFIEFVHADDRAMVIERQRRRLSGEDVPSSYEFRVLTADQTVRVIFIKALIIEYKNEPATLCLFSDITESKQAEHDLRRTKFAMDSAAYSVFQIERDGRISYCNDTAALSRGFTNDEILALKVYDLDVDKSAEDLTEIWKNARKGVTRTLESTHRRKDGSTFPVEVSISFFKYSGDEFCFAFVRDISDRKRAEAERSLMEVQIRQQQKIESISTLASGVAHEINNPINIVMNYAELIISRCSDTEKIGDFAQEIILESQRIATIVRNLLAFARAEREPQQLSAMSDVIDRSLSLMREVLRKRGIELIVELEDDLPEVSCRFQRIQQVLMNLIMNSMDALEDNVLTDDKKMTIKVLARRYQNSGGDWVRTTIEDNGAGIPADIADRIFDPFFTSKARDRGTGLGLSVSHGIVTEHGGELTFSTKDSGFTRFYIDLPVPGDS